MNTTKIIDATEAAEALRVSVNTLAYWRQIGKGPKWARLGKRVFYRETDIEAWINEQFATTAG